MATNTNTYTGNDIYLEYNGQRLGYGQTLTVTRSFGETPIYDFGDNAPKDIAPTRASVTVTVTNMVIKSANLTSLGLSPSSSLEQILTIPGFNIAMYRAGTSQLLLQATGCKLDTDTLSAQNTQPLTINATFQAQNISTTVS